jgi:23S rRNA pseudouridine1911/1915/1917 synthase
MVRSSAGDDEDKIDGMKVIAEKECKLADLLVEAFGTASKTTVKHMITHGNIKVNGKMITNPAADLRPGDQVEYLRQQRTNSKLKPPYPVYFEDDFILIAEKPAGLLTIGEKGVGGTSFYKIMQEFVKEKSKGKERLFIIHRLDREVSGLLLFAKTEEVQQKIKDGWRDAKKLYYALVEGATPEETGTVRSWLAEGRDQKVYSVRIEEGAKLGITHYRVMDRSPEFTLLEVELETGRKNQIRVHMSDIGCPIVGDRKYGADSTYERRIRLHAFYIGIKHPETGRLIEAKSKMPKGFLSLKPRDEKYK